MEKQPGVRRKVHYLTKEKETAILGPKRKCSTNNTGCLRLRDYVESHVSAAADAAAIARLDVCCGLAEVACLYGYVRPEVTEEGPIIIEEGRTLC